MESEGKMTTTDARGWINALIKAMHEETNGSWPDPKYKDEVYSALGMAIQALSQEPCERFEWGIDGKVYKITKAKDGKEICQQVCDDAISRQELLGETIRKNSIWNSITNSEGKNLEEIIFELPPVNPQPSEHFIDGVHAIGYREGYKDAQKQKSGEWIPVSERLPEDKTYVLTTIKVPNRIAHARSGWYEGGFFHNDNGDTWNSTDREVVAWMPLPNPCGAKMVEPQERSDKE